MGADIADVGAAQGEETAVGVERQLGVDREIAALVVAEERLLPLAGPFHRAAEAPRRPGDQREFRDRSVAGAEIAADLARDDAHRVLRHAEDRRQARASGAPRRRCRHRACSGRSRRRRTPIAARGSIGTPVTRWIQVSSRDHVRGARERRLGRRGIADIGVDADVRHESS